MHFFSGVIFNNNFPIWYFSIMTTYLLYEQLEADFLELGLD